jgi:hypothetical protein
MYCAMEYQFVWKVFVKEQRARLTIGNLFDPCMLETTNLGLVRLIPENGSPTGLTTTTAHTGTVGYLAYELVERGELPTTASCPRLYRTGGKLFVKSTWRN